MAKTEVQNLPRRHVGQLTPPQNANNQTFNGRFKGRGNPNGQIVAYQGDSYLDLDTGVEWNKMTDNDGKASITGWEAETEAETEEVLTLAIRKTTLPTIYATDPAFGAVGDYTGTQNTAGTGTDNRAAIQAALNAAYTQGPGGFSDTVNNVSHRVVIPKGKYYISARSDGLPSLVVHLKCELDFSEAELHFQIPPLGDFGHAISEPNPLWCAIKLGQQASLTIGKMQTKAGQDQTYGGAWFGMNLDAVRVQESDISFIRGGGKDHFIFNFRGVGIRCIATYNTFISELHISSCCYGIMQSYFGTAYAGYTRYRGTSAIESVCTSIWIQTCSFLNIYKGAIWIGSDGDYYVPASGGLEVLSQVNQIGGGPISVIQCAFENIAEDVFRSLAAGSVFLSDIRIERGGWTNSLGMISASECRSFRIQNLTWQQEGGSVFRAEYVAPGLAGGFVPNPGVFVRVNATNVAPELDNVWISNTASLSCQLVNGNDNVTRLPILKNYRTAAPTHMQGTNATYMQNIIIENDGGRIWAVSVIGLAPVEVVNGILTTFTFLNGFTRQKPKHIVVDGVTMEATDVAGTNWTWNTSTTDVTFTVAPTKSVRAFF